MAIEEVNDRMMTLQTRVTSSVAKMYKNVGQAVLLSLQLQSSEYWRMS